MANRIETVAEHHFRKVQAKRTWLSDLANLYVVGREYLRHRRKKPWRELTQRYRAAMYGVGPIGRKYGAWVLGVLSPTRAFADFLKHVLPARVVLESGLKAGSEAADCMRRRWRARVLRAMNLAYRFLSLIFIILLATIPYDWICVLGLFLVYYGFSRANEVFYAFTTDAIRIAKGEDAQSGLRRGGRIKLALWSYVSLLIDFAIIYYLFRHGFTADNVDEVVVYRLGTIWDAVYFSGVTMTTLGYGDISPTTWFTKLIILYQVACGIALFVLSIAIYAGSDPESSTKSPYDCACEKETRS